MSENEFQLYHRQFMYYIFCLECGHKIGSCESYGEFNKFIKEADIHIGDCTSVSCTCSRCLMQSMEINAQLMINSLSNESGHCGKKCEFECEYEKPKN